MNGRIKVVSVGLGLCALIATARADFVGGVERFNGTAKDTFTWQEYYAAPGEGSITQNNSIELLSPRAGASVDYTTNGATVGVGGAVQVDLSVASSGQAAALFLGTNSAGTSGTPLMDDHFMELALTPSTGELIGWIGGDGGASSSGSFTTLAAAGVMNVTLRIERPTVDSVHFLAYDSSGNLLGSDNEALGSMPYDLYVALYSYNADATFDNVTLAGSFSVPAAPIPEPSILLLALVAGPMVVARRRRRGASN